MSRSYREVIEDTLSDITSPFGGEREVEDDAIYLLTELENEGFKIVAREGLSVVPDRDEETKP